LADKSLLVATIKEEVEKQLAPLHQRLAFLEELFKDRFELQTVTLNPGYLGFLVDWATGLVTYVADECVAKQSGLAVGDFADSVERPDGSWSTLTSDTLKRHATGTNIFKIRVKRILSREVTKPKDDGDSSFVAKADELAMLKRLDEIELQVQACAKHLYSQDALTKTLQDNAEFLSTYGRQHQHYPTVHSRQSHESEGVASESDVGDTPRGTANRLVALPPPLIRGARLNTHLTAHHSTAAQSHIVASTRAHNATRDEVSKLTNRNRDASWGGIGDVQDSTLLSSIQSVCPSLPCPTSSPRAASRQIGQPSHASYGQQS
jgi:hypothetical protein